MAGVAVLGLVASGCADGSPRQGAVEQGEKEAAPGPSVEAKPPAIGDLDPAKFSDPTTIDNEWWPLKPGKQMVWEGEAFEDGERIDRRVVFTVTDLTKEVAGVRTLVGYDRDYNGGILSEAEVIFLAQDDEGNVWHFGQYRENYEEAGELAGGRAWLVGSLEGARAGILMKAQPKVGEPAYSQGFAPPPYNWDDHAKVDKTGEKTCVRTGCYEDVLVVNEFEPTKPGAAQLKYYARGVGNVRVGWAGEEETERETMELVGNIELTPEALATAREEALALESRAYAYGRTPPMESRPSP